MKESVHAFNETVLHSETTYSTLIFKVCLILKTLLWLKCRTAIKELFLYFNLCLSVMLDSLLCSFTFISVLTSTIVVIKIFPFFFSSLSLSLSQKYDLTTAQTLMFLFSWASSALTWSCINISNRYINDLTWLAYLPATYS